MILLQSDASNTYESSNISKYNTENNDRVYLTDDDEGTANTNPSWSYDGSKIVYTRRAANELPYIWTMDADGSNKRQLTAGAMSGNLAVFSPDGSHILFGGPSLAPPQGTTALPGDIKISELWLMNSDGSDAHPITYTTGSQVSRTGLTIQWAANGFYSPDGSKIVYASTQSGRSQIWMMNANGTGQTQLTFPDDPNAPDANAPVWSPDGSKIVFWSGFVREYGNIYTINPDGSDRTQLTFENGINSDNPAWSPDGASIIFESGRDGSLQTWIMDVDGSNQRVLQPGEFGGGRIPLANGTLQDPGPAVDPSALIGCGDPAGGGMLDNNGNSYGINPEGCGETPLTNDGPEYANQLALIFSNLSNNPDFIDAATSCAGTLSAQDTGFDFDDVTTSCSGSAFAEGSSPGETPQACAGNTGTFENAGTHSGWCLDTEAVEWQVGNEGDGDCGGSCW